MCLIYRDSDSGADFLNEESRYGNELLVQNQATQGLACRRHTHEGDCPIQRKSDVRDVESVFSSALGADSIKIHREVKNLVSYVKCVIKTEFLTKKKSLTKII